MNTLYVVAGLILITALAAMVEFIIGISSTELILSSLLLTMILVYVKLSVIVEKIVGTVEDNRK